MPANPLREENGGDREHFRGVAVSKRIGGQNFGYSPRSVSHTLGGGTGVSDGDSMAVGKGDHRSIGVWLFGFMGSAVRAMKAKSDFEMTDVLVMR
jgi:hypothetical protein